MGIVHFKILCASVLMGPDWWLKTAFEQVSECLLRSLINYSDLRRWDLEFEVVRSLSKPRVPNRQCSHIFDRFSICSQQFFPTFCRWVNFYSLFSNLFG